MSILFVAREYKMIATAPVPSFADDHSSTGRTVWGIGLSSLATIFAATWVTVHPDVPFREESSWSLLKRRILLALSVLLWPEMRIMKAFNQWQDAKMIKETINNARPKSCM